MTNLALAKLQGHAILLVGPDIYDIFKIIHEYAQSLLCIKPTAYIPCGVCKSCHLIKAGTHPDLCIITPVVDTNSILVDQIRVLKDFMVSKPQFGKTKVVILYPAEAMNNQAANALLKNLEEPGDNTKLFLLTAHQDLLLKTIVSRCQILNMTPNTTKLTAETADILLTMREDLLKLVVNKNLTSVQLVEKWVKQWPSQVLYCLELLLAELITAKYTQQPAQQEALIKMITAEQLWRMLEQTQQARNWINAGQRPNLQLVLDSICLEL